MVVQVGTSSRRQVHESSLCLSARFCENLLELKHVSSEGCPVRDVTEGEVSGMCAKTSMPRRGDAPYNGTRTSEGEPLHEDMSLHEAGVAERVHKVAGMYALGMVSAWQRDCESGS
jgi:hypothetical protein